MFAVIRGIRVLGLEKLGVSGTTTTGSIGNRKGTAETVQTQGHESIVWIPCPHVGNAVCR